MSKTALVISGGGSKGAFATGVVKQLAVEFPDISFDILVGTSTGALIVPFVALDELDLLEQVYTSVRTEDIYLEGNIGFNALEAPALFDTKPLGRVITQHLTDARCQQLLSMNKEVYIATTCLQTRKPVYFSTKNPPLVSSYPVTKMNNNDQIRRAVKASASQPVFMVPVQVNLNAQPVRQYVDGGVREYAGLQLAIDAGADEIFVVLLSSKQDEPAEASFLTVLGILQQTLDIFLEDVGENDLKGPAIYNRALRYIDAVKTKMTADGISEAKINEYFTVPFANPFNGKKPLKIHVIRPDEPLGGGPGGLFFEPAEMQGMVAKGRVALSQYMASLPPDGSGNV